MTRTRFVLVAAVVVLLAVAALPAVAQTPAPSAQPGAPAAKPGDNPLVSGEQLINQIQRENEAVITGRRFTYDPTGRRDPFEPLIKSEVTRPTGPRPKGIAGMLVTEIDLRGVATDVRGNPVAIFRGTDNRGYSLRVNDVVFDGRVISIDPRRGVVVFRQQVDDPRRIKPYRDVIKRLQKNGGAEGEAPSEEEGA